MDHTGWTGVAEALADLDFPATKEQIVAHAREREAPPDAERLLRGLAQATYRNISEVRSSVPLDPAADEGQTAADKAQQARARTTGVAEHMRAGDR
jgi:hypothetical protein